MRAQRRTPVTVTLVHSTAAEDRLGNSTAGETRTVIPGAIFDAAQAIAERTSPDQAEVYQPAVFNLPGVYAITADDLLEVGAFPDAPAPDVDVETWEVIGGGTVLLDRTRVPVTQTRSS